jgi:hypothetical protein
LTTGRGAATPVNFTNLSMESCLRFRSIKRIVLPIEQIPPEMKENLGNCPIVGGQLRNLAIARAIV